MPTQCPKCNGTMERGFVHATLVFEREAPQIEFTLPGPPTPWDPVEAFKQGLRGESDRDYNIVGMRCSSCGSLELYANDKAHKTVLD